MPMNPDLGLHPVPREVKNTPVRRKRGTALYVNVMSPDRDAVHIAYGPHIYEDPQPNQPENPASQD